MKKELTSLLAIFALLFTNYESIAQNPSASIATWKNDADGAYSFIHDDYGDNGVLGINNYADTIARNRGIKFTFGAITSACENNPQMWTDAIDMINYGHEIINHTHNHYCAVRRDSWCTTGLWAEPATEDFDTELDLSTNLINTRTGTYPRYFIYPYDLFNAAANDHLKTLNYIGSRTGTYEGTDPSNFTPDADGFFRSALIVNTQDNNGDITAVDLDYWADYAATNSVWVNREMHNVGNTGWGRIPVTNYRNHLNHLKTKMDANELWVGTISEVLTYQIQKLNYTPNTAYSIAENKITITWNTPSFNVANYLSPLAKKSPVTILVNLDGIDASSMTVEQASTPISGVTINGGIMKFDAYPHEGTITISSGACSDFCLVNGLTNKVENVGNNTSFNINLTHTGTVTYAWYLNNILLPGENNSTLLLNNVQVADGGTYKVIVTKGNQTIESSGVLTITNQQPYNNNTAVIPGTIQFEEFDAGGQDISYNESSGTNQAGANIRTEPVDIEATTGGGYNVGYVTQDEWLEYTVSVTTSGTYFFKVRHASQTTTGSVKISINGVDVSNSLSLPMTGGWQTWTESTFSGISLSAGQHILRVTMLDDDMNLDYMVFELDQATAAVTITDDKKVEVYPNPSTNHFTLKSDKGNVENIQIHSVDGQLIKNITTKGSEITIGEDLNAGLYLVEFTINGTQYREKIIKK